MPRCTPGHRMQFRPQGMAYQHIVYWSASSRPDFELCHGWELRFEDRGLALSEHTGVEWHLPHPASEPESEDDGTLMTKAWLFICSPILNPRSF